MKNGRALRRTMPSRSLNRPLALALVAILGALIFAFTPPAFAAAPLPPATAGTSAGGGSSSGESEFISIPTLQIGLTPADSRQDVVITLQIVALMTVLSLAPAILLMLTCFTRVIIVLGFVQRATGLQQTPPQQVLAGLALFLTLFIMTPTWTQVYDNALGPYIAGNMTSAQAWDGAVKHVRSFMLSFTRQEELSLMYSAAKMGEPPRNADDIPLRVLIPAFMISELKTAFQMGVVIYIPFIVVDMIVSSVLLAMGMMMLPPMTVSLPFKLILFVMADGWNLVIMSLFKSFSSVM